MDRASDVAHLTQHDGIVEVDEMQKRIGAVKGNPGFVEFGRNRPLPNGIQILGDLKQFGQWHALIARLFHKLCEW